MAQTRRKRSAHAMALILAKTDSFCAYCGTSLELEDEPWHIDHAIPLFRGGADEIENLLPACSICNRRKRTLLIDEFREAERNRLLNLIRDAGEVIVNSPLLGRAANIITGELMEADKLLQNSAITFYFEKQ